MAELNSESINQSQTEKRRTYSAAFPLSERDEDIVLEAETRVDQGCCARTCDKVFPAGFWLELKNMAIIVWPICITQVCQMIIGPISLIFCGHLGDPIQLDGAAMAISMINATCISVGQGLGTACDTTFSQSFGSRNKKKVGLYMQKALLIFTLALLVCLAININMELILNLLGQDPEVSRLAGSYMIIFIPGAFGFFMYVVLAKFVQNQNIVYPNVVIGLIANALNAVLHYVFLYQLKWGPDGSAIAQSAAYVSMFLMTLFYIVVFKKYRDTWDGWSLECLQDWGKFTRLAIPGMLMVCLEWWGFEIGVFLTGLLGTTELGAQSVLLQIDSIWFQIPLGIQIACSIRIGQYLGSGSKLGAITVSRISVVIVFALSVVMSACFLIFRYQLPLLFTNVKPIAELTGDLLPIVALYMFFDGIATACKGVLYGTGRQVLGAVILFISYYILALPVGVPLMFLTSLRSAAYWWALSLNLLIQAIVLLFLVYRTKWDDQIEKAQERAGLLGEELIIDDDEEEPLIPEKAVVRRASRVNSMRRTSRQRCLSSSLSASQIRVLIEEPPAKPAGEVIFQRILTAFIFVCILGAGVAVKLLVHLPEKIPVNGTAESLPDVTYPADLSLTTPIIPS